MYQRARGQCRRGIRSRSLSACVIFIALISPLLSLCNAVALEVGAAIAALSQSEKGRDRERERVREEGECLIDALAPFPRFLRASRNFSWRCARKKGTTRAFAGLNFSRSPGKERPERKRRRRSREKHTC